MKVGEPFKSISWDVANEILKNLEDINVLMKQYTRDDKLTNLCGFVTARRIRKV